MHPHPHPHPHRFTARTKLIERLEARLRAQSWPRFQMALIVAFTGLAGLLASAVMLRLGLHSMALRYPLATVLAYAAFLGLLWLWMRTRAEDWSDAGDGVQLAADAADCISPALRSRGGGLPHTARAQPDSGSDGPNPGSLVDADELAVVILVVVAVVSMLFSGVYLVFQAPALLAEVALDGAVAGSLYHRLHQAERQHWVQSAWGYTRWPLCFVLITVALVGWGLGQAVPGAVTLGQALAALFQS